MSPAPGTVRGQVLAPPASSTSGGGQLLDMVRGRSADGPARCRARLTTVLDDDFLLNLRLIHNLPPFLVLPGRSRRQP